MTYTIIFINNYRFPSDPYFIPQNTIITNARVIIKNDGGRAALFFGFDNRGKWEQVPGAYVKIDMDL